MTTDVILCVCLIIVDVIGLSLFFEEKGENICSRWTDIFLWDWIWYDAYHPETDRDSLTLNNCDTKTDGFPSVFFDQKVLSAKNNIRFIVHTDAN